MSFVSILTGKNYGYLIMAHSYLTRIFVVQVIALFISYAFLSLVTSMWVVPKISRPTFIIVHVPGADVKRKGKYWYQSL